MDDTIELTEEQRQVFKLIGRKGGSQKNRRLRAKFLAEAVIENPNASEAEQHAIARAKYSTYMQRISHARRKKV